MQEGKDKALATRSQILKDIWEIASQLGSERHYDFVIPNNLTGDGLLISVIATGHADDITEAILTRLNKQYATKHPK